MAGAGQKKCPSCGAPLPVDKGATSVKCPYCGTTVEVQWTRVAPPPNPSRPPTVYVSPGLPRAAVVAIALTAVVPVGISLLTFFGSAITNAVTNATFPLQCGNNEALEVVGKTFSGQGTLITAGLNCKLHIKNCRLSSDVVVLGKLNVNVTIENSTLEGKDAAIWLDTNGEVHASNGTVLRGTNAAVRGGVNTKLEFEDTRLEGGDTGITGDVNTEVHGTRTSISGHDAAILLQTNGHVFGSSLTVAGQIVGVEGGTNLEIALEASTVRGEETGVKAEGNLHARLTKKSNVAGKIAGIDAGNNLELSVDDSVVESDDTGALARWNPHLKIVRGARVHGGRVGVDAGENLELTLQQGTIESAGTALCGKHNGRIEARGGAITGAMALHFEHQPEVRLTGAALSGSQVFDGKGCTTESSLVETPRLPRRSLPAVGTAAGAPARPPLPVAPGAPPFDSGAAVIALDAATRAANAQCRSSTGGPEKALVTPGFSPDGRNSGATVGGVPPGSSEALCIGQLFRGVRIPPFDPATRPAGLMRAVDLK
jgi:LSD1 subclass zinc finger protein